ncbi:membrane protein YczE [Brachybacterium sp. AOP43-C2-M15]|uniref:membrane protein YczE n=1 Tax=Brachybacterium sp. AOP43-C2-M15 TaxID=3457661 RepID=UPI00403457D8
MTAPVPPLSRAPGRRLARLDNLALREQLRVDRLPLRLLQMMAGLTGFGFSLALLLESGLGGAPWDVLHAAVADRLGATVGAVSIAVSFVLLVVWIPLRERIGIGTIANGIWVGVSIDLGMLVLPEAQGLPLALAMMAGGVVLNGVSGAVYIGAQLGAGPRDGLMTGLGRVLSRPVGPVRIVLEIAVLVSGWALGGPLGVGTVVYAMGLGPIIQLVLPHVTLPVRTVRGREKPLTGRPAADRPPRR